jgi:hypothetical protein
LVIPEVIPHWLWGGDRSIGTGSVSGGFRLKYSPPLEPTEETFLEIAQGTAVEKVETSKVFFTPLVAV